MPALFRPLRKVSLLGKSGNSNQVGAHRSAGRRSKSSRRAARDSRVRGAWCALEQIDECVRSGEIFVQCLRACRLLPTPFEELVRADLSQRFPAAFCEQTGKSRLPLLNVSFISSKLLKFGDELIEVNCERGRNPKRIRSEVRGQRAAYEELDRRGEVEVSRP
jgi:hypothetical protein